MKAFTSVEIENNFSKIINMIKSGEEILVSTAKGRKTLAVIVPYEKYKKRRKKRPLGILKGVASYVMKEDFKISDEEFLSL